MGRKTEKSMAEFRKANALAPDGGIDQPLLAALFGDAAAASGDPNSANDVACDEFTVTPGTVEAPQRSRTPSTCSTARGWRPRTSVTADSPRRSRRPPIDDEDDEPPPRGGPYYGPPVEMGIGIGVLAGFSAAAGIEAAGIAARAMRDRPGACVSDVVLPVRIELTTSPLPRGCSTTELRQLSAGRPANIRWSAGCRAIRRALAGRASASYR